MMSDEEAVAVEAVAVVLSDSEAGLKTMSNLFTEEFNETGARLFMSNNKWPVGIQDLFIRNLQLVPIRFFVCDDSGSMSANDSRKIVSANGNKYLIRCSRWSELIETLRFHADLAMAAQAPSEFRFINTSRSIMIGSTKDKNDFRFEDLKELFKKAPENGTPLCRHIKDVVAKIKLLEKQLRDQNKKACVIIATDGEPTDGDLVEAMKPLKDLPVIVVVKLCTDDQKVVDYWNKIDTQLELDMDVIDDIGNEAAEIHKLNPWLTYGESIQRMREFGVTAKELDFLDEVQLSMEQLREFSSLIFGGSVENFPHPEVDWSGFTAAIRARNNAVAKPWNAIEGDFKDWIMINKLNTAYNRGGCCSIA